MGSSGICQDANIGDTDAMSSEQPGTKKFLSASKNVRTGVRVQKRLPPLRTHKPGGDSSVTKVDVPGPDLPKHNLPNQAYSPHHRPRPLEEAHTSHNRRRPSEEAHLAHHRPRASEDDELDAAHSGKLKKVTKHVTATATLAAPVLSPAAQLVNKHPLFEGTRKDFRNLLFPYLEPHIVQAISDPSRDNHRLQQLEDMLFQPLSLDPGPKVLMRQGETLPASHFGLLLVDPDSASALEVLHNDVPVAQDGGLSLLNFALGQEVIFNLTERCLFTIRMLYLPPGGFYFIEADRLNFALNAFPTEQDIVVGRARDSACSAIHTWMLQFGSRCIPKLFCNASRDFISSFMQTAEVRVYPAGALLAQEGQPSDACIYLSTGKANVTVKGSHLTRLTSGTECTDIFSSPSVRPAASWESWWGTLEAGGTCIEQIASVTALTDCIVWALAAKGFEQLRESFPLECSFIDRIAVRHLKLVSPFLPNVNKISFFSDCGADFVEALSGSFVHRIYKRNENIVKEGDEGDEMFVLMHGKCSVLRGSSTEPTSRLHPGSCFGGLAILNIVRLRSATIKADTLCDVRVLNRPSLLEVLQKYPEEEERMTELVEAHSESRKAASTALEKASAGEGGFSDDFIRCLVEHMYEQPFMMRQVILQQGAEGMHLVVLVHGMVEIEANNIRIAEVEAPAIFGERGLLHLGSKSGATVRSMTVAECMLLPLNHSSIPDIKQFYAEDIRKLESMLDKKMSATKKSLTGVGEIDKGQGNQSLGFLKDCSPEFLSQVSAIFEKQVFLAGTTLFTEGMETDLGFIIHQGTATVTVADEETGRIGPGEFVGEFVILGASLTSTATVRADTKVVAFSINAKAFQAILEEFPEEKHKLHETMRQRILAQSQLSRRLTRRGSQQAQERHLLVNVMAVSKFLGLRRTRARKSVVDQTLAKRPKPLPGYREGLRWVEKRKKAIASAKVKKELREFIDPLSTAESFRPPEDGIGTPWSKVTLSGHFGMRVNKSRAVYGRRVWSECDQSTKRILSSSSESSDTTSEESDQEDQNDASIIPAAAPGSAEAVAACAPAGFFQKRKTMKEQMDELRLEELKRADDETRAKRVDQQQSLKLNTHVMENKGEDDMDSLDELEEEPDAKFIALRRLSHESMLLKQFNESCAQTVAGSGAVDVDQSESSDVCEADDDIDGNDDDDDDDYDVGDDAGFEDTGQSITQDKVLPSSLQGSSEKQDAEDWAEISIDAIDIDTRSNSSGSSADIDDGVAKVLVSVFGTAL